jgi:O-antigen ligase
MVCVIGLLLAVTSPIRAKGLTIAACGLGVLLSLSSAPIQCAILGLGLLAYDRILARVRSRWSLLIGFGALGIGASYAFITSPLAFVFGHLLIDSSSYWTRLYQWNTVGIIVLNSPWVGIGFELREVAQQVPFFVFLSVDSVWLMLALVYGIPGAVLVGLSMVSAACYPSSGRGVNLTMEESKLATTLGVLIVLIVLLGFTVDFWEASWMSVGLVVGVRAHLADLGSQRSSTLTKTDPGGARRCSSPSISRWQTRAG